MKSYQVCRRKISAVVRILIHRQIIFLFFGAITVGVSLAVFLWMPNSPTEAKFLSDEDKVIAIERLRNNQMGIMSREWRFSHLFEAVRDLKTWLWAVMIFCISVPSNGISTFGPLIIESFVSDPFQTMLFNVPVGITHIIAVSGSAYVSMKWKLKGPPIALLCVPPIIGCSILLHFTHGPENKGILLAGYFCLSTFTGISESTHEQIDERMGQLIKRHSSTDLLMVVPKYSRRYETQMHICCHLHQWLSGEHCWATSLFARGRSCVFSWSARQSSALCRSHMSSCTDVFTLEMAE